MKKLHFLFLLFSLALALVIFSSHAGADFSNGYASPDDGLCGDCHAPSATAGEIDIAFQPQTNNLLPNTTYTITITLKRNNNAPEGGFQMSAMRDDNSVGTYLTYPATAEIASHVRCQGNGYNCAGGNSVQYLEHKPGLNILFPGSGILTWQTTWKSPSTPGPVTFTVGGVLSDGSGGQTLDDYSVSYSITKDVIAPLSVSATSLNVSCFGGNNGAAFASASGSDGNYTYLWSNGQTTSDIFNLSAGTYTVTVTSGIGTTGVASVQISQPSVIFLFAQSENTTCPEGSDGSITLNSNGGTLPHTYLWSNGVATKNIFNLTAGTYTVTVTDLNGCTKTISKTVGGPPAFTLPAAITQVTCFGLLNGSINLTPGGGTQPYTYSWSNGLITQDISGLAAGPYTVTITDSKSCSKSAAFSVNQPPALTLTDTLTPVTCFGLLNGAINLTPSGGTPGYSYLWSNDSTTQDLTNLAAGTYSVVVTDQNSCSRADTVTISQPAALALSSTAANASCFGLANGAVDLSPSGGTPGYSYLWSNDSTTQDLTNLAAGTYSVVVSDQNNCTGTDTVTITQPAAIVLSAAVSDVPCFGQASGAIDLNASGGSPGYSYAWSNGAVTQNLVNLKAGAYSVVVTDQNNCTGMDTLIVAQPAAITLNAAVLNASCFGLANGAVDLNPAGGTPGYSYLWSNGATSQDLTGVAAGTYSVAVTDQNNCTRLDTVTVAQPTAITLNAVAASASCFGQANGAIDLTPAGGTPGYSYLWSNGAVTQDVANLAAGSYSVVVTDANNCSKSAEATVGQPAPITLSSVISNVSCFGQANGAIDLTPAGGTPGYSYLWSNGAITQDVANLTQGTYSVTIFDSNNCSNTGTVTVMQPSTPLSIALTPADATCFGQASGAISLVPAGGTPGYTYVWSNGSTEQSPEGLPAGDYSVTVTDVGHCTATGTATIGQPTAVQLSAVMSDASCFGSANGSIDLTPEGGIPGYVYVWSNGAVSQDLGGLKSGIYTVTVTDMAGCQQTKTFSVGEATELLVHATVINISCFASPTGGILLDVTGGTLPYSFLWSTGDTTQHLSGVPVGFYSITLTDAHDCTFTLSESIVQAPPISISLTPQPANCFGAASGGISADVSGGAGIYSFLWSNGATTQHLSNIPAGTYSCTVTDAAGCTSLDSATVVQPATALSVTTDSTVPSVDGGATGSVFVTVEGATPPYTFIWIQVETGDTISFDEDLLGVPAGEYRLLATDANGCLETLQVKVDAITSTTTAPRVGFILFPNPNDGRLTIRGETESNADLTVRIGEASGRVHFSRSIAANEFKNGINLNLEHLPAGAYLLQVWSSDHILGRRLLVVNR